MFLPSGDRYLGGLPKLHKRCQIHFCVSRGNLVFLYRHCSGKGPHLTLRGKSPGCSRVVAGNLGFLSSYDGDLRYTFLLPQENQFSMLVGKGISLFLFCQCQGLGPHLELRSEPQGSSPGLAWILGFLWSFNKAVSPRLMWRHASLLSFELSK